MYQGSLVVVLYFCACVYALMKKKRWQVSLFVMALITDFLRQKEEHGFLVMVNASSFFRAGA